MNRDESDQNPSSGELMSSSLEDAEDDEWEEDERPASSAFVLPVVLFALTVFTVLWAGAYQTNTNPLVGPWDFLMDEPRSLWSGIPFAATLLGILVTHELGHYVLSRLHGVPTSLPLFVPGLPHFVGTFGAIIRMRAPLTDRRALFDIGVAGPIAGFVVAVIALVIGLRLSTVVPIQTSYGMHLGEPLLLQFASWVVIGPLSPTADVILHPVGFAAWFGLFITSLNLLPIGQLDGGHVAYALLGERQRSVAVALIPILMLFGWLGWKGWFLWVGLAGLMGLAHPPVRNPGRELGGLRLFIGWIALLIFVLTFSWEPFILR
ncbi:MAG: site-2 protease family protein [Nitrospira sp.]|jgi:membrane-associated protease RseP (regulator of RpoE activity)|nr:site-2 protease family protein [Nitrospira sp.]HAP41768.1 peptidase M50 [Nitrospira sp.]